MSDELPLKPRAGLWFFFVPIGLVAALVLGYATLFTLGARGRPADGARVTLAFSTCAEAQAPIERRVAAMGLGEPVLAPADGGFALSATLPADEAVAARIPDTLVRRGQLAVRQDGAPVVEGHVERAILRMDFIGEPTVAVELDAEGTAALAAHMEAHPEGQVELFVDDEPFGHRTNSPVERGGKISLRLTDDDRARQVERVAALALVLADPLPCPASVSVAPAAP